MTKLTTERLDKLQYDLLQFQDFYSDPADKKNYDIFVEALHMLDEFKAAKEKLLAYEQASIPKSFNEIYFSYGSEHGFDWHKTEKEAIESAEAAIDDYRGDACDGWSDETDSICWGVILQQAAKINERPRTDEDVKCDPEIDTICDYALLPNIRATTDINDIRAQGINFAAGRLAAAFNHGFVDKPLSEVFDVVRMILSAKEDLFNNPAEDGLSGEYANSALLDWELKLQESE